MGFAMELRMDIMLTPSNDGAVCSSVLWPRTMSLLLVLVNATFGIQVP